MAIPVTPARVAAFQPRQVGVIGRAVELVSARRIALLLVVLFVLALGIRLYEIDGAPLDFHAARQYRSFIIARQLFYDTLPVLPDWQRQVAAVSAEKQGMLEPPIMEGLVAAGYRLLGGEQLWLPALLSSIIWLAGAAFLFSIVRRIASQLAAVAAVTFYLLLPFAVAASRSFQPDPLLVTLMVASVWAIVRYDEAPSMPRLGAAASISALAFLSQPRTVPIIVATFLTLMLFRQGLRPTIRDPHLAIFAVGSAALPAAVYGYGVISGTFRTDIAEAILLPQLWISPFLWSGWLSKIDASVGLLPFFGALFGVLLFRAGRPRAVALGLWLGYFGFGLVFDYAVATHDYYHLQLVPIVAISLSPLVALVVRRAATVHRDAAARVMLGGVLAAGLAVALLGARAQIANPDWQQDVAIKREIGAAADHSVRTVFLSADYGTPLEYHGMIAGFPWPLVSDLEWERLAGIQVLGAEERFVRWFEPRQPEFFIIEDFSQLAEQPDLQLFLGQHFPVAKQTEDYVIYDLRSRTGS